MNTPQMSSSIQTQSPHWLNFAETLAAIASVGGSTASLIAQQAAWATVPLSVSFMLNLLNRQRLLGLVNQQTQTMHHAIVQQTQEQQGAITQLMNHRNAQQTQLADLMTQVDQTEETTTHLAQQIKTLQETTHQLGSKQTQTETQTVLLRELENATQLIQSYPDNADYYYQRGIHYQQLGNAAAAIADYGEAIRLGTSCAGAYHQRGVLNVAQGDRKQAVEDFRIATKLYFEQGNIEAYQTTKALGQELYETSTQAREALEENFQDASEEPLLANNLFG